VVSPDELDSFVRRLPLKKIPGVGEVTLQKLHQLGLYTCEDVRQYPYEQIQKRFGKFGHILWQRAHGIDERDIQTNRVRKSVGVERTLSADIHSEAECLEVVEYLYDTLVNRLALHQKKYHASKPMLIKSLGVKLKFQDFQLTTVEHRYSEVAKPSFQALLKEAYQRARDRGIRLVGLQVGLDEPKDAQQLLLPFDDN
jgi:DNA polymerase-4